MSYFNTTTYDPSNSSYNSEFPIYIDGSISSIPMNGAKYCGNVCGNVMASFVVDNGDSILNGNVLLTQNLNIGGGINILPTITTTTGTTQATSTFVSGNTLAFLAGATSNIQTQLNSLSSNAINQTASVSDLSTSFSGAICTPTGVYFGTSVASANHSLTINPYTGQLNMLGYYGGILSTYAGDAFTWNDIGVSINGSINGVSNTTFSYIKNCSSDVQSQLDKLRINSILNLTSGTHNYALGEYILPACTSGSYNVGVGCNNLTDNVSGFRNCSMGNCAGTGVQGSDNVCLGTNSGAYPASVFNQSSCIGAQSRITGSNQVVLGTASETVVIPGSLTVYDNNTSLSYNLAANGAQLKGYAGGILSTTSSTPFAWGFGGTTTLGTCLVNGYIDVSGGCINLNSWPLYLKSLSTDRNHSLIYNSTVDGPVLKGFGGGALATPTINALTWSNLGAAVNGTLVVNTGGKVILNDSPIYFRPPLSTTTTAITPDTTNSLAYDATLTGMRLKVNTSGALATNASGTDVLTWNSAGISVNGAIKTSSITTPSSTLSITGGVSLLPYNSNTILSAYTLNCNAVSCLGQIVAGGSGLVTAKLQCSNNGTGVLGLQMGSFKATSNSTQTVTFPNTFLGTNAPLVFLQVVYGGIGYPTNAPFVVSSSLTNFTYNFSFSGTTFNHAESYITVNYVAFQI